jgi:CHASE3 domain sensor protein
MPPEPLRKEFEFDLSGLDKDKLETVSKMISNELRENKSKIKALRADDPQIQEFIALRNSGRRVKTMLNAEAKAIRNEEQDNTG